MTVTEPSSGTGEWSRLQELEERGNGDWLAAAPGLARLALTAYLRTLGWGVQVSIRTVNGALKLVLSGEGADAVLDGLGSQLREQARRVLGVTDIEARLGRIPEPPGPNRNGNAAEHLETLRERGADLLARSAGVDEAEFAHPAYERILNSLAPDEARILRLMYMEGARAAVDVRTWRPLGAGSELIEPGLTMIGRDAGCRRVERVPAYLNNLQRLGLVLFSREPLDDLSAYQVLEVQPDVVEAMERAGRGKTVRRSVHLTPFGKDFCDVCLPLDTGDFMAVKRRLSNGEA